LSGGLDCSIVQWSLNRGKHIYHERIVSDASGPQTFNPPMVHSLSITPDGRTLAAGVGDGSVAIFPLGTWKRSHTLVGHSSAVSVVEFAAFGPTNYLFSGSNDSTILLWNITKNRDYSFYDEDTKESPIVIQIKHNAKINALTCSPERKLYVGDQSNEISLFSIHE